MKNNCFNVHTQDKRGRIQLCPLQCSSFCHGDFSWVMSCSGTLAFSRNHWSLWQVPRSVLQVSCMDTGRLQAGGSEDHLQLYHHHHQYLWCGCLPQSWFSLLDLILNLHFLCFYWKKPPTKYFISRPDGFLGSFKEQKLLFAFPHPMYSLVLAKTGLIDSSLWHCMP